MTWQCLGPEGFGTYEVSWCSGRTQFSPSSGQPHGLLIPGFVDLHIHGAFGIDFMTAGSRDLTVLCERLAELGYETFLPTTVAARAQDVLQAVERLPEHPMIPGFHLEGPFLSPAFPGAQPPTAILDPIEAGPEWDEVFDHPKLRLVTLAPERPGAPELIARLASRGVVVSMGHTDATWMEARQGFAQGARHTTHTFNAMRALHHREPGALGFALGEDRLYSELIYDRIHVSRAAAEVLVRCKPADRLLAVSDSSMATGLPDGSEVAMWGHRCVIHDGSVRLADGGSLAGSTITLYDAFRNMAADFGPEAAILACCLNPRRALGLTTEPRLYLEVDSRSFAIVQRHQVQH